MADTESNYKERADDLDGEETNLIDVADVSEVLTEEQAAAAAERRKKLKIDRSKSEPSFSKMPVTTEATIAKLSDRFAAYLIDTTILFYIYLASAYLYRRIIFGTWTGPLPIFGFHGLVFNGSFAVIALLYYFVLEGIFFATLGKALCGLVIRRSDGGLASMLAIFSRNIFRVVDYQLCNFVGLFFMEMTRSSQRLGDIVAGTTVLKKGRQAKEAYHVSVANIASASGRAIAFLLDTAIFAAFCAGIMLSLTPDRRLIGQWIILSLPLIAILYFTLIETLAETTPGKLLFGYIITFEDGNRITFSASLVRTLMRPIDLIIGLVPMALSPKKQRIGDLCAGTIVTKQRRNINGLIGAGLAIALCAGTIALGWNTPKNLRSPDFEFAFMPDIGVNWGPFASGDKKFKELAIRNFRFAVGTTKNIRTPAVYSPGEKAYILFEVVGYQRDKRKVWLQEDLTVRYPDLTIGLKQDNMIDYNKVVKSEAPIELVNEIALPATAGPGRYNVTVTVRDILGGKQVSEQIPFTVRLPLPETPTLPPPMGAETPSAGTPSGPVGIPALPPGPPPTTLTQPAVPSAPPMTGAPIAPATPTPPVIPTVPVVPAAPPVPSAMPPSLPPATAPAIPSTGLTPPATGVPPAAVPTTPPAALIPAPPSVPSAMPATLTPSGTPPAAIPAMPPQTVPTVPTVPPTKSLAPTETAPSPAPGATTPPSIPAVPAPATPAPAPIAPPVPMQAPAVPAVTVPVPATKAPAAAPTGEAVPLSPKGPTITPLAPTKETLKTPPAAPSTPPQTEKPQQPSMVQGAEIKIPVSETPLTTLTTPPAAVPQPVPSAAPSAVPSMVPPSAPVATPPGAPATMMPTPVPAATPPAAQPQVPAPLPIQQAPVPPAPAPVPAPATPSVPPPAPTPVPMPQQVTPAPTQPALPAPVIPAKPEGPALKPPAVPSTPQTPQATTPSKAITPPTPSPAPAAQPPAKPAADKIKETPKPQAIPPKVEESKKPPVTPPKAEEKKVVVPAAKPAEKKSEPAPAAPAKPKPVITAPPLKPEAAPAPTPSPKPATTPKTETSKSVKKESMAKAPSSAQPAPAITEPATAPSAETKPSKQPKTEVQGSASPSMDKAPAPESRSLDLDY